MTELVRKFFTSGSSESDEEQGSSPTVGGVPRTAALERIKTIRRERWQDQEEELAELGAYIQELYHKEPTTDCEDKCPCGGTGTMTLLPVQVATLRDAHDHGGVLAPIAAGGGKTAITFLAGNLVGAKRVLLVAPANLLGKKGCKGKTEKDFDVLAKHWHRTGRMKTMSYSLLGRDRGAQELLDYMPDLVVADESHRLKNKKALCTQRMGKYLTEINPKCAYLDMSGTMLVRSLMDMHHRMKWALPPELHPLPAKYTDVRDWADAVDEDTRTGARLRPGRLMDLYTDEQLLDLAGDQSKDNQIKVCREAVMGRIKETPGVVATEKLEGADMPIILDTVSWKLNDVVTESFRELRDTWTLPNGDEVDHAPTLWRTARCLVQGFYYEWDPKPPEPWMRARREWSRACRGIIGRGKYATPYLVAQAIDRGDLHEGGAELRRWRGVQDSYKINTKTVWLDDGAFNYAKKWAEKEKGLIWVNERALGRRLHVEAGIPYYAANGFCGKKYIEDEKGACVVSVEANKEGRNLQWNHSKNLFVTPIPGGAKNEQVLARTHRIGQPKDEVVVQVGLNSYECWSVLDKAIRFSRVLHAGQDQRLMLADRDVPSINDVVKLGTKNPAWDKVNDTFFGDEWTTEDDEYSKLSPLGREMVRQGERWV